MTFLVVPQGCQVPCCKVGTAQVHLVDVTDLWLVSAKSLGEEPSFNRVYKVAIRLSAPFPTTQALMPPLEAPLKYSVLQLVTSTATPSCQAPAWING